jgi:hypothetical protein
MTRLIQCIADDKQRDLHENVFSLDPSASEVQHSRTPFANQPLNLNLSLVGCAN